MTTPWDALPDTITTFMTALAARQVEHALATLTTDAVITDEGHDHRGHDEIGAWIGTAASEYSFTTEFTGATRTEAGVDVRQHLEGDFPGGVADLTYRFTVDGTSISRLVIEP
ncbi:nuclear transport factor 2 family protein [Mycolicibacterium sp. 3033]|nr:nuclear transport factor 2 family protein [Mycolicibacterium aurantiacum]